jgi:hypothetical protein
MNMQSRLDFDLTANFRMNIHFFKIFTEKNNLICPELLYLLYCFALEIGVVMKLNKKKQLYK